MPKDKPPSRPRRWTDAATKAVDALEELITIQEEYQEWRDNLPENLDASALAEKLDMVTEIDLESARDAAEEARDAELPLGFGRD